MLDSAEFPLQKCLELEGAYQFPQPELVEKVRPREFRSSGFVKVVRPCWLTKEDVFAVSVQLADIDGITLTKHLVVSLISKVYNPVGLESPLTITAKLIL